MKCALATAAVLASAVTLPQAPDGTRGLQDALRSSADGEQGRGAARERRERERSGGA